MSQFLLSIRKISLAPFLVEMMLVLLFGVYEFTIQYSLLQQPYHMNFAAMASELKSSVSLAEQFFLPQTRKKTVHIQYYDQLFDVETNADTFGELAMMMPLGIAGEHIMRFWPVKLTNDMEIHIPPNLYQIGVASWYGTYFHGRPTASTEPYNMYALTAAHRTLPLGTKVKITNLANKRVVMVRINDRGPYVDNRVIDLSFEAARQIGSVPFGLVHVAVELVN